MSLVTVYWLTLKQWQYSSSLNWMPASFPDPTQLSITWSTEKRERAWYLFSHEWCQDRRDGRKALIVCGAHWAKNTKAKVPGNLPHVSSKREETVVHTKYWVCSLLKICETYLVSSAAFCHFPIMYAHVKKDTRLSLIFRTARDGKLGGAQEWGYWLHAFADYRIYFFPYVACGLCKLQCMYAHYTRSHYK